jgi:hypothetical protein
LFLKEEMILNPDELSIFGYIDYHKKAKLENFDFGFGEKHLEDVVRTLKSLEQKGLIIKDKEDFYKPAYLFNAFSELPE